MKKPRENKQTIELRDFRIEDYDALIRLWDKANLPYKPKGRDRRDKIETELKRGHTVFLVAEMNNQIIGSIFGTHDGRKGWINRLAVSPECRNRGIARMLVNAVETKMDNLGIDIIACLIEDWNKTSRQVFKRLGYREFRDIVYFTKRKYPDV